MGFPKRLKELRNTAELSQEQLGEKLKVTKANVSKYETGRIEPNIETITFLAEYFNVSIDYLLGRTDIKNPYTEDTEKDVTIPIAAHFKGKEMTEEQRKRIEKFIEFTLNEDD